MGSKTTYSIYNISRDEHKDIAGVSEIRYVDISRERQKQTRIHINDGPELII